MFCTIQLSKLDSTPLYVQLANELARLIKEGVLKPKTKLPTIRSLSQSLNINRDTVVSAYKLLENQSLVYGHVGSGTYVASFDFEQGFEPENTLISCSTLNFPSDYYPIRVIRELMNDIINIDGWSAFSDPLQRHRILLKQTIVDFLHTVGLETSAAQIRVMSNDQMLWSHLLKLHTTPYVCIEAYHDPSMATFLKSQGVHIFEIPMTPTGMDLVALESVLSQFPIAFICVSSYIQNPTGICYDEPTKKALLSLCTHYNCYLVDDITYIDFAYHTPIIQPLFSLDTSDRVITLYHFSKVYLSVLNYSFLILPLALSKRLFDLTTYTLNEHILSYYLRSDYLAYLRPLLLEQTRTLYLSVSETLKQLTPYVSTYADFGGLAFFLRPLQLDATAFTQHFLSFGIVISPCEIFSESCSEPFFRVSIAHLNEFQCSKLKTCLEALASTTTTIPIKIEC